MARKRRLEEAWNSYVAQCIPPDAPPVQIDETRKAFYGGALSLLAEMLGGLSEGPDAEEADVSLVEDLQAELDEFGEEMRKRAEAS